VRFVITGQRANAADRNQPANQPPDRDARTNGGDPNLDPFRANQLDVSLERYLGKDGIYSGAVFYKDIVSFITDRLVRRPFLIETNTPNLSRCTFPIPRSRAAKPTGRPGRSMPNHRSPTRKP